MVTTILLFELSGAPGAIRVTVTRDGAASAEGDFDFDETSSSEVDGALDRIKQNRCETDDLRYVGSLLWSALLSEPVETLVERAQRDALAVAGGRVAICLRLPSHLEHLPWEALYDERQFGFLALHSRHRVLRLPSDHIRLPDPSPREPGPLSMLVVVPEGSRLGVAQEWHNINMAIDPVRHGIDLQRIESRVTAARLRERLQERDWDIVHFIGHGEQTARGEVQIRLNAETAAEGDYWMEAEAFGRLFDERRARLVVLNCCFGDAFDPSRTLSGVSPFLLLNGVSAVVAMRYAVQDDAAVRFAGVFYRELLVGRPAARAGAGMAGDVAEALFQARMALDQRQTDGSRRTFITPVLHQSTPDSHLFEIGNDTPVQAAAGEAARAPAQMAIDTDLLQSLTARECLIVVGPDIAAPIERRAGPLGMRVRELAMALAHQGAYPVQDDLTLCGRDGDWTQGLVLAWICQHYEHAQGRVRLVRAVQQAYVGCQAPKELLSVARWNPPGVVYFHFDGLMEEAFREHRLAPRVLAPQCQQVDVAGDDPLLLNVFGSLKDPGRLMLTEDDRERLLEQLGQLPSQIKGLVQGHFGRTILYLGLSPRDPLVRRLNAQLQPAVSFAGGTAVASSRTQGPTFFACQTPSAVDEAYWAKFDVRWVKAAAHQVIAAIEQSLGANNRARGAGGVL